MNPLVKPRWIERLRSGDYEQGRNVLNRNGKFCCLGVLMEIAAEDAITSRIDQGPAGFSYIDRPGSQLEPGSWSSLTVAVQQWSGLDHDDQAELMGMNDTDCKTFAEIADYIEENL